MADLKQYTSTNEKRSNTPLFNPFPGLRPFSIDESHLFFGREGQSEEVLIKLAKNRFVGVLGASGSGKSSLMYCGLLPILYGGFITEAGSRWRIVVTRPGTNPIDNLGEALAKSDVNEGDDPEDLLISENITRTVLRRSSLGLVEAVKQFKAPDYENVLLMVDQFEELFRYKRMQEGDSINETEAFVKLLVEAQRNTSVPIYIVLTMRSDFIGDCANFQALTKLINESHYLIPQMTRENFKDAIVGPVAVGGGKIDPHLVQQLLNEVGDNPDQLPILQHAMMRTWDYWVKSTGGSRPISFSDYEAIGRMERALSDHANEAYDELDLNGKRVCQTMFKALTERGADNRGIRRPTSIGEIGEIARADLERVVHVVDKFRKEGRSFLAPSHEVELSLDIVLDISHESLMRVWDRLKIWVDEEGQAVQMYNRLCEAAQLYQEGKSGLWRPPDLQLALNWRDKEMPTLAWARRYNPAFERAMVYLKTSERDYLIEEENKIRLQKRQLRRSKIFALVLGTAAIISLGLTLYSFMLRQEAVKQRMEADKQTAIAEQQRVIAENESQRAEEQRKLAERNAEEAITQRNEAERQRTLAIESAAEARRQEQIATQKSEEAIEQRELAEINAREANEQREAAEQARNEAFTRRMLSISQSMAVKAQTFDRDVDLKGLLAYQAYVFNDRYDGSDYNSDIYLGLYSSIKAYEGSNYNTLALHRGSIRSIKFVDNGQIMYTSASDGKVLRWKYDSENSMAEEVYTASTGIKELLISNSYNELIMANAEDELSVISLRDTSKGPLFMKQMETPILYLKWMNDENAIIGMRDTIIYTLNLSDNKLGVLLTNSHEFESFAWHKGILIASFDDNKLMVFKNNKKSIVDLETEIGGNITDIEFANSKPIVAIGDINGNVLIYNFETQQVEDRLGGHRARISDMAFSPDDVLLATASFDGNTQLWEVANFNNQPIVISDIEAWVTTLEFTPDGKNIVAGSSRNRIKIWPAKSEYFASRVCGNIKRNFTEEEWRNYVAPDIQLEKTCKKLD